MRAFALAAVALALAASACGQAILAPYDTAPKPPPPHAHEEFNRVGVCYNRETSTPRQVMDVARRNCDLGTRPWLIEQDMGLTCPLLTPTRATFACLKPGLPPPVR